MIDRINISHSGSETVEYCFMNYFFRAVGVWTVEVPEASEDQREDLRILILGGKCKRKQLPCLRNRIYLVKKNSTYRVYKDRSDVIAIKWNNMSQCMDKLMKQLFPDLSDRIIMQELMKIFLSEGLWGAMWIFHEISYENDRSWDEYIARIMYNVQIRLRNSTLLKKSWNHRFMDLYCSYIHSCINAKSDEKRTYECRQLLGRCSDLAREKTWTPTLCFLTAKICEMSRQEEKFSLYYYRYLDKTEDSSGILYCIGHIYEKLYGDYEQAMEHYKEALRMDGHNYRALYKIAVDKEMQGNWIDAIQRFIRIRVETRMDEDVPDVSVRRTEYEFKSIKRVLRLAKSHIDNAEFAESFQKDLTEMQENLESKVNLDKLLHCMFGRETEAELKKQILNEVHKKLLTVCDL